MSNILRSQHVSPIQARCLKRGMWSKVRPACHSFACALSAVVLVTTLLGSADPVHAQSGAETKTLKSVTDGWPLQVTYFPAPSKDSKSGAGSPEAGVAVLLHGEGGDRQVWEQKLGDMQNSLVDALQKLGLAVLTVDMRKHGKSNVDAFGKTESIIRNDDYQHMWQGDLEAIKQFLMDEHMAKKLNVNKLAIIAAGEMAPIAARFAVFDWSKPPYDDAPANSPGQRTPRGQDVRALVLLSPSMTAGSINIMSSMRQLRDPRAAIAMLVLVGKEDPPHARTARTIERAVRPSDPEGENQRSYFVEFPNVKFSGADLLGKTNIPTDVLIGNFLDKHLVKLDSPWQDRRSRLDR